MHLNMFSMVQDHHVICPDLSNNSDGFFCRKLQKEFIVHEIYLTGFLVI